jgi:hypothetical protein
MAITTLEITSTTHAAFLPDVWADDTQDAIEFKEVLSKLCNTSYESQMSVGRILHIPHYSNSAAQSKTEGITNTIKYQANTQTNQDITVDTYQYAAFLLNAVVQAQSKYDDRAALSGKAGYALMRGMEVNIAALFDTFSQTVGTLGGDIDDSVLRRAWQYLADAGYYEDCAWAFSPGAAQSLFAQDRVSSKDFAASGKSAFETALLPNLYSHPAYVSNLLEVPASGQHENALFHKSALILIRQVKPTVKSQYRIEYNADAMLVYDLYTVAESQQPTEAPIDDGSGDGSSGLEVLSDLHSVFIKGQ